MNVILQTRIALIRLGKVLPFVVCLFALITYTETAFALSINDFVNWGGYVIPNTPISWLIGQYFEYNIQTLVILVVISFAIKTCLYNKLACLYLGVNLWEKWYFDFEMELFIIGIICMLNILFSAFLVYKGIRIYTKR